MTPTPRDKRRIRKPRGGDDQNGEKPASTPREPPFHNPIPENVKSDIANSKGIKLVRNTVDVALGGSRIKLGQGGYASLVDATKIVGEGTFTCDAAAQITFKWERCLDMSSGAWAPGDASKLVKSISLAKGTL